MAGTQSTFDKHILILTPGFPKDEADSACLPFLHVFVSELVKHVRKVSVVAVQYPYSDSPYTWENVSIYPLNGANNKWKRLLSIPRKIDAVFTEIDRADRVDLIHSFWLQECAVFGRKLSVKYGRPILLNAVGQDALPEHNRYLRKVRNWQLPTTCLSLFHKTVLERAGYKDVQVIEWGHAPLTIQAEKSFDLVCAGNLTLLKNPVYFIDICEKVAQKRPNLRALLIGDGPLRTEVESQIKLRGLQQNVQLAGQLGYTDALQKIAQSRVLIHASHFESFGMVLTEALALGTHVFSAPVGIAFSEELMHKMTRDSVQDTALVMTLLEADDAPVKTYPIAETVAHIIARYKTL